MNTISTIQKQHRVRSIIKIIIYACLGALFLYGAIHKYIDRLGEAAATSIIGGADGPTSVFFAGKLGQTNLHRNRNGFLLYGVLAAGLLIYALYNLVLLIKEAYLKRLRNDLSNYKISEYDLDSDFSDSNQFYHVSFGKRFFLYAGKEPFVIPYDRIIWAFVKTKRRIKADINELKLLTTYTHKNYFQDIFVIKKDIEIENLVLQAEETVDAQWATPDELQMMIDRGEFVYSVGVRYAMFGSKIGEAEL